MSAADVIEGRARWHVERGDCREWLASLVNASIDACVTDPPYELGFMGRAWDRSGIAYDPVVWAEVLRVLKPGAHLLAFGGTRTSHRMVCAIEDAGFEVRDSIAWMHGQGFPKSLNVGGGRGTALKPAHEPVCVARKPLAGTVAANLAAWGCGALNIDATRISTDWSDRSEAWKRSGHSAKPDAEKIAAPAGNGIECHPAGRWPANVVLSHLEGCREVGVRDFVRHIVDPTANVIKGDGRFGTMAGSRSLGSVAETVPAFDCAPGCPVAELDAQSGTTNSSAAVRSNGAFKSVAKGAETARESFGFADTGGASRFFYAAKPSTAEREAGCEHLPLKSCGELVEREDGAPGTLSPRAGAGRVSSGRRNHHPTVKGLDLMRWLCRLVTPPGGLIIDPFTGSGSTGAAATLERFRFLGCDLDESHVAIANARIAYWDKDPDASQGLLFAGGSGR